MLVTSINNEYLLNRLSKVHVKAEKGELGLACTWLRKLLFGARLDPARLAVAVNSLLASIPDKKRSASTMAGAALAEVELSRPPTNLRLSSHVQHKGVRAP